MQNQQTHNFKLITFASNKKGTKVFCRFAFNKKTLIKGYYDFNKELFFITEYNKKNFIINEIGKNTAKTLLKQILQIEYDWTLANTTNTR